MRTRCSPHAQVNSYVNLLFATVLNRLNVCIPETNRSKLCKVCCRKTFSYCCPKCTTPYCGVECYKAHDGQCTEKFFEDQVVQEMKVRQRMEPEARSKMVEILRRVHESQIADESRQAELLVRSSTSATHSFASPNADLLNNPNFPSSDNIDDGDAETVDHSVPTVDLEKLSLDQLTADQQADFFKAVEDGRLAKYIEPWVPWWRRVTVISECSESLSASSNAVDIERVLRDLPHLSTLHARPPSPLLSIHLIDILYAFAYTIRLYNGDLESDAAQAAHV